MDLTLGILTVWVLAAAGVQLGTLWIMKLSILPMLNKLAYDRYVVVCQLIDMHVFHPIAVWNGVIAAGLGVWAAFLAPSPLIAALFVIGSVGMVIVGITSEGFNRPIWRQIERWSPERTAQDWSRKRVNWHIAHQVRTYGAIGALVAYIAAFVAVLS
ncbi:hypothetical protein [Amycolatopsis taiwanensis]|uniref:DUF1772 domain-containing protein n=1 Tax=Amycolatopsis taiwanensis TaxID=342230 RepID=A0A9W6R921_9PSEU|nr:hypothetical protein [Amycolatopsis taiwanensis]GLY69655.1 hypothetical protein Atai01_62740 [Amycolatopsis taiwanensis]